MDTTATDHPGPGAPPPARVQGRLVDGTSGSLAFVALLTGFILARLLGPIGLGEWLAIVSWPLALSPATTLGLRRAMAERPDLAVPSLLPALWSAAAAATLVAIAAWGPLPWLLDGQTDDTIETARWFLLQIPLGTVFVVATSPLRAVGDQTVSDWLRSVLVVLWAAVVLIAVLNQLESPTSIALSFLGVEALAVPLVVLVVVLRLRAVRRFRLRGLGSLLRRGRRALPVLTLATMTRWIGPLVLIAAADPDAAGTFAGGALWAMVSFPFVLWFDEFVNLDPQPGRLSSDALRLRRLRLSEAWSAASTAVVLVLAPLAAPALVGADYEGVATTAALLAAAALVRGATVAQRRTLEAAAGPTVLLVVEGTGLAVALGSGLALVGPLGAAGVALAVLMAAAVARTATIVAARRQGLGLRRLVVPDHEDWRWCRAVWRLQAPADGARSTDRS